MLRSSGCRRTGWGQFPVQVEHLFSGSALARVDAKGRVQLPAFVRSVMARRGGDSAVLLAPHESDRCLSGHDRSWSRELHGEAERRRLRDEAAGAERERHHRRARRMFGLVEEADPDAAGRIVIPRMARSAARIDGLALFVGTGGTFEIWNPQLAIESGDEALASLARYRLEERDANSVRGEE